MIQKINWKISGDFCKSDIILKFFRENNLFSTFKSISVYDGVSRCLWNGGRMHYDNTPAQSIKEDYYKIGWGINLTFSNFDIDINDPLGNELLHEFHKEGNGIILVNENFRKYLRKNFPKYKLIHSVTGCGHAQELPLRDRDVDCYLDSTTYEGTLYYVIRRVADNKILKLKHHESPDLSIFVPKEFK